MDKQRQTIEYCVIYVFDNDQAKNSLIHFLKRCVRDLSHKFARSLRDCSGNNNVILKNDNYPFYVYFIQGNEPIYYTEIMLLLQNEIISDQSEDKFSNKEAPCFI